jgi:1,4-alpha-glucan branching enzyme
MKRKRVTFELSAPKAQRVCLVGEFNAWDSETHPMIRECHGKWKRAILLGAGTYQYALLADGKIFELDRKLKVEPGRFQAPSDRINVYFSWTWEI